MIKVISFKICPFVQRVTALLEAKQIPYEIEYISLSNKPQRFSDISPHGQVPVLVTESGVALFESDAIVEYLDEVTEPLNTHLSPERKAINRAWSYQATKHYLTQCSTMRSGDKETFIERTDKLNRVFAKMENALNDGPFFNGKTLSNVDIAWLPLLHRASIFGQHTGYDFLANYPKLKKWQSALIKTGWAKKSVADDFETRFIEFYLPNNTCDGAQHVNDDGRVQSACC